MLAYNPHYMYPPLYQFHDKVGQFYITQASLYYRPVTIIIYILYMVLSFWLPTGFWWKDSDESFLHDTLYVRVMQINQKTVLYKMLYV